MKSRVASLLILFFAFMLVLFQASCEGEKVCYAFLSAHDTFRQIELADAISNQFGAYGYDVKVLNCENDIEKQKKQIACAVSMRPAVIIVDIIADIEVYRSLLEKAHECSIKVIALNCSEDVSFVDIRTNSSPIYKGMRMCELVTEFIDEHFADTDKVKILVLETSDDDSSRREGAGYRLLSEKYMRYYNIEKMEFICFDTEEKTEYVSESGDVLSVDEPSGGLILDLEGRASINPYYDERVELCFTKDRNVNGTREGSRAIDAYIEDNGIFDAAVVIAANGEAAIGAAKRLEYYEDAGMLTYSPQQIAVFGSDDSAVNRELVVESWNGMGFLRGYVCGDDYESVILRASEMLFSSRSGEVEFISSSRSAFLDGTVGLIRQNRNSWENPDIYFEYGEDEK